MTDNNPHPVVDENSEMTNNNPHPVVDENPERHIGEPTPDPWDDTSQYDWPNGSIDIPEVKE